MEKRMRRAAGAVAVGSLIAVAAAAPAAAQERYAVGGDHVAIYNLAGTVEIIGTSGGQVTVEVTRGGADAERLDVQIDDIDGRRALRVLYPSDRVVYRRDDWSGNTEVRVRADGTWNGRDGWRDRGERVRVSSRGSGLDAHADLRIGVPRGQRLDVHVAVGRIRASNVDGRLLLDTHTGGIEARSISGPLSIDTGSGGVRVAGIRGDLWIDTGSGGVRVSDVRGSSVEIDTGSGGVEADAVHADAIEIDTGSGGIDLLRSSARNVRLDTGSGSVEAELSGRIDDLLVDTGSGSVTLRLPEDLAATIDIESGSGGIDVDFPLSVTRRARGELRGQIGDGGGRIRVDTGSGSVRLRRP